MQKKVSKWMNHVCVFSDIALTQPHLAYITVIRSLQHESTLLLRVLPDCGALFQDLELSLATNFCQLFWSRNFCCEE